MARGISLFRTVSSCFLLLTSVRPSVMVMLKIVSWYCASTSDPDKYLKMVSPILS